MKNRRSVSLLSMAIGVSLIAAACGSDNKAADTVAPTTAAPATSGAAVTTEAPATTAAAAETTAAVDTTAAPQAVSLKGLCPDTINLQIDWMPEAEHGFIYQMIGAGYTIDKGKASVTGPLIDQNGNDTGVKLQLRSGGAAQHFDSPTTIMYNNEDTLLAFVYTDEAIQNSVDKPTVAIESGFNKNPQMIMWDPAVYPDVTSIADLGTKGVTVRYFQRRRIHGLLHSVQAS